MDWRWIATSDDGVVDAFPDPLASAEYVLCIYDRNPSRLTVAARFATPTECGGHSCWREVSERTRLFARNDGLPDGIRRARFANSLRRAVIRISARAPGLALEDDGGSTALRVQLVAAVVDPIGDVEACWESAFASGKILASGAYTAKQSR